MLNSISKVLKAVAEPTRLKIIKVINVQPMCVCELSAVLDMLQPRISQHLRILRDAELVLERKEGYFTYYSLNTSKLEEILRGLEDFLQLPIDDTAGFAEVAERIASLGENEAVNSTKAAKGMRKGDDSN